MGTNMHAIWLYNTHACNMAIQHTCMQCDHTTHMPVILSHNTCMQYGHTTHMHAIWLYYTHACNMAKQHYKNQTYDTHFQLVSEKIKWMAWNSLLITILPVLT